MANQPALKATYYRHLEYLTNTTQALSQEYSQRILPRQLTSGSLKGVSELLLGDENIKIDPANRRIVVSDGTYDRVLIGYQEDGF